MSILLIRETLPVEIVVGGSSLALYFLGILTIEDILAGFSSPLTVLLASLFVVGGALFHSGVASSASLLIAKRAGTNEAFLRSVIIGLGALLSSVMSSTGTVSMMIPAISDLAKKSKKHSAQFLLPLAYGCLVGGMLTLIGTAPNLVVQKVLTDSGRTPFNFFSFTPIGLVVLFTLLAYYHIFAKRLLPSKPVEDGSEALVSTLDLTHDHGLNSRLARFRVPSSSAFCHQSLSQLNLRKRFGVNIISMHQENSPQENHRPSPEEKIIPGQVLLACAPPKLVRAFAEAGGLERTRLDRSPVELARIHGASEIVITPRSPLLGKNLEGSLFQERLGVTVISILRLGKVLELQDKPRLQIGDSLLLVGPKSALERLPRETRNFIVTALVNDHDPTAQTRKKYLIALLVTLGMALLMALNIFPPVIVGISSALVLVTLGCLTLEDAYRSISWQSLLVISCMLPMATALERTGGIEVLADSIVSTFNSIGPRAVIAGLFLITALFSQIISNTATTIIMAPVALRAAESMSLAPEGFLMAVAIAASAAFATPMGSPVNMLVVNPGGYRFNDFLRNGIPLQVLVLIIATALLPYLFPM